jgi:hypothetical protein
LEAYHDDGTFDRPDNYRRFNGVLRYSRATDKEDFNVTALGYSGIFDSSDQIPQRPTERRGLEITNFFTPAKWLTIDADYATSTARFRTDPSGIGTGVPEALASVASVGVTVDRPAYTAALRFRYFGPRILIEDGSAQTRPTELVNAQFAAKLSRKSRLTFDVYNLLGANADDTTYFYNSWTRQDGANPALASDPAVNPALGGAGVADYHVHSTPKRTFRVALTTGL